MKSEQVDWLELARGIHKAVTDQAYAGEIVDLLRRCGMIKARHPEVLAWAKAQDKADGRIE